MEIRTLRYFLETAREENMSKTAERLHISQSTLSKQLKGLEEELGKKLFIRHSFSIELTEEGMLLRKRAEDLLAMADKITAEFSAMDDVIGGNIYFGCAESYQIWRVLSKILKSVILLFITILPAAIRSRLRKNLTRACLILPSLWKRRIM